MNAPVANRAARTIHSAFDRGLPFVTLAAKPPHFFVESGGQVPQVQTAISSQMPLLHELFVRRQIVLVLDPYGFGIHRAAAALTSAIDLCFPFMPVCA